MNDPRLHYLVPVVAGVAVLVLGLMAYAGFLTSTWGSLFWCLPAILVTIAIVSGMASGVLFFGSEESETPREAARLDGTALFARIEAAAHRLGIMLHVRGLGR